LDVAVHRIQDSKLEIITSEPLINYRETVKGACEPVMAKSPNRHNKIFMKVEPLEPEIAHMLRTGEISDIKDKTVVKDLLKNAGWDTDTIKRIMKLDSRGNILINGTKGVQFVHESTDSINSGFEEVMKEGPLCREQMRNCKFIFTHFVPHEDTAHRGLSQLGPASRRACMGALLTAGTSVLEPTLAIEVRVPTDLVGNIATILSGKRGKVLDMSQKGAASIVIGEIPAAETFTLSEAMRGQTAGRATWNTSFKEWTEVPKSMLATAISDIRKRKGLAPDPPGISDFIDKD
jgi:elongation factor 2